MGASTTFCVDSARLNDILGPTAFGSDSSDDGIWGIFGWQDVLESSPEFGGIVEFLAPSVGGHIRTTVFREFRETGLPDPSI